MTVVAALDRAEKARIALNVAPRQERAFRIAEAEYLAATADLAIEVELALGVPARRIVAALS